jgi:APA family basic amino acid/polyamine antiporter
MVMIMGQSHLLRNVKRWFNSSVFSKVNPISGTQKTNLMILGGLLLQLQLRR